MKARQVCRLLRHDAFALCLVDVLPGLLAHCAEHGLGVLREIHEQRPPRLHVDRRAPDAVRFKGFRERVAFGRFGIAEQADGQPAAQRLAKRDDRVGQVSVVDERTARRIRDIESPHEALAEHLNTADPRVPLFEDVALRAPAGCGLHLGPSRRLEKMRTRRLVHQPVPALRLVSGGWPCPHRAQAYAASFPGVAAAPGSSRAGTAHSGDGCQPWSLARALGEGLALLALLEAGARVEASVPPELDHDRSPALGADAVGGLLGHVRLLHALVLLFHELRERLEELADDGDPLDLARGDTVEVLLHPNGEARVDDLREVLAQEIGDDEADVLGHEGSAFLSNIPAIHQRGDRRRVCRRPADAELLERLDERRFREARRRLREMLRGIEAEQLQGLALLHFWERRDLFLGLVARLEVHAEESVEKDAASVRTQEIRTRLDVEARVLEARRRHLGCDRPLPDDRVQLELVRLEEALHAIRRARKIRRPYRLMRFLRTLRPRLVVARLLDRVRRAEFLRDDVTGLMKRAFGDVKRVGTHVGDETDRRAIADRDAFVELLGEHHRFLYRVAELARRLLLQRRGRERRRGIAAALALLNALDGVGGLGERGSDPVGGLAVVNFELVTLLLDDLGGERLPRVVRERGLEGPVLLRLERLDLALAVDDEAERDRLDAAGGEAVPDLLPEERGHRVSDEPVDD